MMNKNDNTLNRIHYGPAGDPFSVEVPAPAAVVAYTIRVALTPEGPYLVPGPVPYDEALHFYVGDWSWGEVDMGAERLGGWARIYDAAREVVAQVPVPALVVDNERLLVDREWAHEKAYRARERAYSAAFVEALVARLA